MAALSSIEMGLIHGARYLVMEKWSRSFVLFVAILMGLWILVRMVPPPTRERQKKEVEEATVPTFPQTTLYDPERLQTALHLFTEATTRASGVNGETRGRTEALCRNLLEQMLGFPLPKVRPKWLVNPTTNRCLELDMYSEQCKLAFEVDGAQHDVYTPHFHQNNPDHFQYRKLLDQLKNELCHDAGVHLIRIPYHKVSCSDQVRTTRFLESILHTHGIPFRSLIVSSSSSSGEGDHNQHRPVSDTKHAKKLKHAQGPTTRDDAQTKHVAAIRTAHNTKTV
jgi:hypothetical protein